MSTLVSYLLRAEGAVLGSTDGRRSGRAVEAAQDVGGGRHVEEELTAFIDGHSLLKVAAKFSRGHRTALVDGKDKSGVLGEASGRDGRRGRPVEDFGHDVVSGLLGLFRFTVRHDVTGRPGLFDVAAERLDRLAVREPESRVAGGDALRHRSPPLPADLLLGGRQLMIDWPALSVPSRTESAGPTPGSSSAAGCRTGPSPPASRSRE